MIIRQQQIDTFEDTGSPHFEPRAVQHLKASFPRHGAFLGDAGVIGVVRYAVEQAAQYGIAKAQNVQLFADLTLLLGRFFDSDPQLPWAAAALNDSETTCQNRRSQRLHGEAMAYLNRVRGTKNEFIDKAQERLLTDPVAPACGEFGPAVLMQLQRMFPEKYLELGEAGARLLIAGGVERAARYGIETPRGRLLYIGLMYLLGAGFDRDPLFAWAGEALASGGTEAERVSRLHESAVTYLKQWRALPARGQA